MYVAHELDVTRWIAPGEPNTLAVKVTPERALQDINGVELADSWYDWINWNYLGYQGPGKNPGQRQLVCRRPQCGNLEAGVPANVAGAVSIGAATVNTELPLPRTDSARLTIYTHRAQLLDRAGPRRAARDDQPRQASRTSRSSSRSRWRRASSARSASARTEFGAADGEQSRPVVAVHHGQARPLRPAAGVPAVRQPVDETSDLRFGIRTVSQHRDADERVPRTRQGRQLLSEGQRHATSWSAARPTRPTCCIADDPDRERAILATSRTSA